MATVLSFSRFKVYRHGIAERQMFLVAHLCRQGDEGRDACQGDTRVKGTCTLTTINQVSYARWVGLVFGTIRTARRVNSAFPRGADSGERD
jgi:hypothetical protein